MYDFDGVTYVPERDGVRLNKQLSRTFETMKDGAWHTIDEVVKIHQERDGERDSPASISARFRDFRKEKFGGYIVDREYVGGGLHRYRLSV